MTIISDRVHDRVFLILWTMLAFLFLKHVDGGWVLSDVRWVDQIAIIDSLWLCFSNLTLAYVLDVEIAWIEAILSASPVTHEAAIVAFIDRIVDFAHH